MDLEQDFQEKMQIGSEELQTLLDTVEYYKSIVDAAKEANIRAQAEQDKENFYKLILSEEDLLEIKRLHEVGSYLRNEEPLNKVIWKVYYEKPYSDLIGRVVGAGTHTGIYKITNLSNGMCYVGQAVKLAGEKLFSATTEGLRIFKFFGKRWFIITKPQANEEGKTFSNLVGNFV